MGTIAWLLLSSEIVSFLTLYDLLCWWKTGVFIVKSLSTFTSLLLNNLISKALTNVPFSCNNRLVLNQKVLEFHVDKKKDRMYYVHCHLRLR